MLLPASTQAVARSRKQQRETRQRNNGRPYRAPAQMPPEVSRRYAAGRHVFPPIEANIIPRFVRNTPERRMRSFSAGKRCACQPGFASEILLRAPDQGEILVAGSGLVHP